MRRSQDDFDAEIRSHLEHEAAQLRAEGVPAGVAADAARRRFGNVTLARETFFLSRRLRWLETLKGDVRYALRVARRSPALPLIATAVLGVGIGATVALYSAISGVVLRPLPFEQPEQLVVLGVVNASQHAVRAGASVADFADWEKRTRTIAQMAAYRQWGYELDSDVEPERVVGARVSANMFSMLGVHAILGRALVPDDGVDGRDPVVVLSDSLWRRRFASDRHIVGTRIRLNGAAYSVAGVVPAGRMLPDAALWVPYVFAPYERAQRGDRALSVIGRMKRGVGVAAAREDMQRIARQLAGEFPDADGAWDASVAPLHDDLIGDSKQSLFLLFGATCSLLLVACANLANVLLARGAGRRSELALRAALGASRGRIVRQLVTESLLLVGAGGVVGLAIAFGATRWLATLGPSLLPRGAEVRLDTSSMAFSLLLVIATGTGFALLTVSMVSRLELAGAIKIPAIPTRPSARFGMRDGFVAMQLAVALVLVIDGSLVVTSFRRMQDVQLGFAPQHVLSATVSLPAGRYAHDEQRAAFFDQVLQRASAIPGITSSAVASRLPLASSATAGVMSTIASSATAERGSANAPRAAVLVVSPGFFETMAVKHVAGRGFTSGDRAGAPPVVIVDEALARLLSSDGNVVGQLVHMGGANGSDTAQREIVGVVGSVRLTSVTQSPDPVVYLPYAQTPWPTMNVVIRATGEPAGFIPDLRRAIASVDPSRPVYNVRRVDDGIDRALAPRRLQMLLLSGFALSAFLLAILGVYGILSFSVKQRDREFGVRMALGATAGQVRRLILRQALARIGAGTLAGIALAAAGGALLRGALFGVGPWDVATFAGATALLIATGLAASYVPAWRATTGDPLAALRGD